MKKPIALTIAAIMLAAALSSCAFSPDPTVGANIRTTSSDAADAASWLTERLGDKLTGGVVIGTDASAYGIDVSALEADGYIIRDIGGEAALFAKSAEGLDRAARRYAKTVESGAAVENETYHEGARIKALTVAGRDISEFTVYCRNEQPALRAANELTKRLALACGVTVPVSTDEPSGCAIVLTPVHDEALSDSGYRWSVSGGSLTIEYSDRYSGASFNAVTRFLEKRLDWFGLSFGFEDLTPADRVDVADGESGGETPAFTAGHTHSSQPYRGEYLQHDGYAIGLGCTACHGLQNNGFAGELSKSEHPWEGDQPCWLDEEFFEVSYDDVSAYIQRRIDAGAILGSESLYFVDIAAGDNSRWCQCKKCRKMFAVEGGTEAGAVVTWANRLSEALDCVYPGLIYGIFAYAGTNKPPKTVKPNDLLLITYCFDTNCSAHSLDGKNCTGDQPFANPDNSVMHDNPTMAKYLIEWTKLSDKVGVWYYGIGNGLLSMGFVHTVRDDIRFLRDAGVAGIYWESHACGYDFNWAATWLAYELEWDTDKSDADFDAYYDRVLKAIYGEDAAPLIREYITLEDGFYQSGRCVSCWGWGEYFAHHLPDGCWREHYDTMFALTEAARLLAETDKQQLRLDNISVSCIYKGSITSYFTEYEAGNDGRVAELSRRYALIQPRMLGHGVDITVPGMYFAPTIYGEGKVYYPDLEVQMWHALESAPGYVESWIPLIPTREMPSRVNDD